MLLKSLYFSLVKLCVPHKIGSFQPAVKLTECSYETERNELNAVTNVNSLLVCIFCRRVSLVSPPAPRLAFLTNVIDKHLPQVLLTSDPHFVLQYVISLLLQLNIELSDDDVNTGEHHLNRTLLRENLLYVLNNSVHLTSLKLVQQISYALHLVTVSINKLISEWYGTEETCVCRSC